MKIKKTPPQSLLLELFDYNQNTGIVTRKVVVTGSGVRSYQQVSNKTDRGYLWVQVDAKRHRLHRIIWKMVYGDFDESMQIDHINGVRNDNRLSNLRLVTHGDNNKNCCTFKHNTSGISGVTWHKAQRQWVSYIGLNGKRSHLGYFNHMDEAVKARKEAEVLYNYHPNHGRTLWSGVCCRSSS